MYVTQPTSKCHTTYAQLPSDSPIFSCQSTVFFPGCTFSTIVQQRARMHLYRDGGRGERGGGGDTQHQTWIGVSLSTEASEALLIGPKSAVEAEELSFWREVGGGGGGKIDPTQRSCSLEMQLAS